MKMSGAVVKGIFLFQVQTSCEAASQCVGASKRHVIQWT